MKLHGLQQAPSRSSQPRPHRDSLSSSTHPASLATNTAPLRQALGGSLGFSLLEFLCAGLLLLALNDWRNQPQLPHSLRWVVFFSDISYGLYLLPMLSEQLYDRYAGNAYKTSASALCLRFVIANGIAILVASLSKRSFEDPILRLKKFIPSAH